METHIIGYLLLALIVGIVIGAVVYAKFHTALQAQFAEREEQVKEEWSLLVARAHAERDRLFALLHPAPKAPPAPLDPVAAALAALQIPPVQTQAANPNVQTNPAAGG